MPLEALIFDMDGLMVDTEPHYHAVQRDLIRKYGGVDPGPDMIQQMMGQKPVDSMAIFARMTGIDRSPESLLEERTQSLLKRLEKGLIAMPGLFDILDRFSPHFRLGVATGNSRIFLDLTLDVLEIRDYFLHAQSSDDLQRGKPDPEIYLKTAEKLGVEPAGCLVLEDSSNGIRGARAAGMWGLAVPNESTRNQNFEEADFLADDLFDAIRIIEINLPAF